MAKYRKKPVIVEAVRFLALSEVNDVPSNVQDFLGYKQAFPDKGCLVIHTLEGTMRCSPGDWIIRGVTGELYPCKPDTFAATYEPVD